MFSAYVSVVLTSAFHISILNLLVIDLLGKYWPFEFLPGFFFAIVPFYVLQRDSVLLLCVYVAQVFLHVLRSVFD